MKRTFFVFLVACGGAQTAGPPPPPQFSVEDPGAEPRRVVRYELPVHQPGRYDLDIDLTTQGTTGRIAYPTVHVIRRCEATEVAIEGSVTVECENERATYKGDIPDPDIRAAFEGQMQIARRATERYQMSPFGKRHEVVDDTQKHRQGEIEDASNTVAGLDVVFPASAIGVGARWQLVETSAVGSIHWQRTVTYHLRALDDASATVEYEQTMSAPKQVFYMEPGSSAELLGASGKASGQFVIPLRGFAATGSSHEAYEAELSISANGMTARLKGKDEIAVTVKPASD